MNKCPFCDETFMTEGELTTHIYNKHPEKTLSAEAYGEAMRKVMQSQMMYQLAGTLTCAGLGSKGEEKEVVLERFKYFVRELSNFFG
jgi:hypothetical protein